MAAAAVGYNQQKKEEPTEEMEIKWGYVDISPKDFTDIHDSSVVVDRSLTLEEKCKDSVVLNHFGSGILLQDSQTKENYVLTAEHITVNQSFFCKEESSSKYVKIKEGSITVSGFPATVFKENEEADQALLKIDGTIANAVHYRGKIAGQLRPGDLIIGNGYPDGKHRYSIGVVEEIKENTTIVSFKSLGGNSGGGLYRFGDKGLELVGTTRGGKHITTLERLQELIKGTPLEDDYL